MENRIKSYHKIAAIIIFIALPVLIYFMGDFPRRTLLKEVVSAGTILAFFILLLQFYLSRANATSVKIHKMATVIKWHKALGYTFTTILLVHPFLLVLPRFFESGVDPKGAFVTLLTTFESKGIILGLIAYGLMLTIGLISMFRSKLPMTYKTWRIVHGILSIVFISVASFHIITLGRHSNMYMKSLIAILAITGITLLLRIYLFNANKQHHGIKQ